MGERKAGERGREKKGREGGRLKWREREGRESGGTINTEGRDGRRRRGGAWE